MNSQISSRSENNIVRPNSDVPRQFWSLPSLVTSIIIQNLEFGEKLKLRESSSSIQCHVDDHIRREFIKWKRSIKKAETLSHDEILLTSIEQFTNMRFNPPYTFTLIDKTRAIAISSDGLWRDLELPRKVEDKEKLLRVFYEEADKTFDEKEKKTIFTLTLLNMLKVLCDSRFTIVHPFNRKACLRLQFNFQDLFVVIPFYNYVFDWFSFDQDWIETLLLFIKFMEIKAAVDKNYEVTWVNFLKPMNFKNASVLFGRKVPFMKSAKKPSSVKCCVWINADRGMIDAIKNFIDTNEFDWTKVAKNFDVVYQLTSLGVNRVHASGCRSSFFFKYQYSQPEQVHQETLELDN